MALIKKRSLLVRNKIFIGREPEKNQIFRKKSFYGLKGGRTKPNISIFCLGKNR